MKNHAVVLLFLLFSICGYAQKTELSKKEATDYIKTYYSQFKTEYNYETLKKLTGNYAVEIKGCNCKISYEEYDSDAQEKIQKHLIEFNFNEVDSIKEGVNDFLRVYETERDVNIPLNGNIKLQSRQRNIIHKTDALVQMENAAELKTHFSFDQPSNGSEMEILRAFKRLQSLCKKQ